MSDTEPLDLTALGVEWDDLVVEAREYLDVLHVGHLNPGWSAVDIMSRQADALEALIAEVRRLRELQEDAAAENARLSAWWHAMRRGGLA